MLRHGLHGLTMRPSPRRESERNDADADACTVNF
jgi:hypothetical protein